MGYYFLLSTPTEADMLKGKGDRSLPTHPFKGGGLLKCTFLRRTLKSLQASPTVSQETTGRRLSFFGRYARHAIVVYLLQSAVIFILRKTPRTLYSTVVSRVSRCKCPKTSTGSNRNARGVR